MKKAAISLQNIWLAGFYISLTSLQSSGMVITIYKFIRRYSSEAKRRLLQDVKMGKISPLVPENFSAGTFPDIWRRAFYADHLNQSVFPE